MRTQPNVNAKTDLEKAPINAKHVHVQVCRFKSLQGLLPKPCYNRKHWKGLPKNLGQRMGKSLIVGPSPKKQHASTSIENSIEDMPQEEERLDVNEYKRIKTNYQRNHDVAFK